MTSQVITLTETSLRQTTIRVDAALLRKARFLLDEEGKSINEFLVEQLAAYVQQREQAQPQDQEGEAHAS